MNPPAVRTLLLPALLTLVAVGSAQRVQSVPKGSVDFKAIVRVVSPKAQSHSAHPIRVVGNYVRRAGNWAFLRADLQPVDPRNVGDGFLISLLRREGGRWRVKQLTVGSGEMEEVAAGWVQKHRLPRGLVPKRLY